MGGEERMKSKINYSNEKGITLLVLAVTIVVILILAAITIDTALGDTGIFKTAQGMQNDINAAIYKHEEKTQELVNNLAEGSIISSGNFIPDSNVIDDKVDEPIPTAPTITVSGTQGEENYYSSDVQVVFHKSNSQQIMTYKVEGVTEETVIQDGASITVSKDGAYTVLAYMYNGENEASAPATAQFFKDSVQPIANLEITNTDTGTVQLVAIDSEPSSGLATNNPYTFYYKQEGTDNWIEDGKGSSSSYTYTNLEETTAYVLKAEVKDKAGNIGTSNEVTKPAKIIDTTKPGIGDVTEPTEDIIKNGDTTEIIITPTEDVTVDPDKFIPVDEEGNPIDATVTVEQDEDGNIHITIKSEAKRS